MKFDPAVFAEKFRLAVEASEKENPSGGLCGLELEWNLLDERLRPLLTVGSGPARQSFVDFLRTGCLPDYLAAFSQLEVFHWMIEWATRPYYSARATVYEARLMEAVLVNALARAGAKFGEHLYHWHGNLLYLPAIGHDSIPGNWSIAKRRYLERCVDLYGDSLATAGTHTNLSLPEPLLAWDFMHLPAQARAGRHLDEYKSEFYISATRILRAFAGLFVATSASTPLQAQSRSGRPVVVLTENDSVRNLTFPNPPEIDLPDLYRSYEYYLSLSYDLVRRGVRFGNNNWTPVRARSFAEPVERLISTTSGQLSELYARGLYAAGEAESVEGMAQEVEKQNLMARINLPMGRVEIRTDDGGNPLELDLANLTLKQLLLLRCYADPHFAGSFRYNRENISRARNNEQAAAASGLRARVDDPFTGKPVSMREYLKWTLDQVWPLAESLACWEDLQPLEEMARGAPNSAERMRAELRRELGKTDEVPPALLAWLAQQREAEVKSDAEKIAARYFSRSSDGAKLGEFLQNARDDGREAPDLPVHFRPAGGTVVQATYPDKTSEILDLAQHLIRIPSVTATPNERVDEVRRAATFIFDYLAGHGLERRYFEGRYPAVYARFPESQEQSDSGSRAPILLAGHFDVVEPEPDDSQLIPRIEGDYLWGRGAADMKTVVATYLVWMKDLARTNGPVGRRYPHIELLLVGNEENGEAEPWGTPHALRALYENRKVAGELGGPSPMLLIAGERTGEKGDERFGEICVQNRGIMRFEVTARAVRGHSGVAGATDLVDRLLAAQGRLKEICATHLTLEAADGWQSQTMFPFLRVGTPGVYNVTAGEGTLGVEIRPIPHDDIQRLRAAIESYSAEQDLEINFSAAEAGAACDPDNPALKALLEAVRRASGTAPSQGRKKPGTSARFAPDGQGVVWGQSGIGPHSSEERHYIPSIEPYYRSLSELGELWG